MTSGNRSRRADRVRRRRGARAARRRSPTPSSRHDRPIHRRCEDSVVRAAFPLRRSRGYAPRRAAAPGRRAAADRRRRRRAEEHVLRRPRRRGVPLAAPRRPRLARRPTARSAPISRSTSTMLGVEPTAVAYDLHPEYLSTKWALEQDAELVERAAPPRPRRGVPRRARRDGPALALVFDGTGYGTDGTLWGGELLRCDLDGVRARSRTSSRCRCPGGEAAIREPWRVAAVHLERAGRPVPWPSAGRSCARA